jgi:hypothetical protein
VKDERELAISSHCRRPGKGQKQEGLLYLGTENDNGAVGQETAPETEGLSGGGHSLLETPICLAA